MSSNTLTLRYSASGSSSETKSEKISSKKNIDNVADKENSSSPIDSSSNSNDLNHSNSNNSSSTLKIENSRESRDSALRLNRGNLISRGNASSTNNTSSSSTPLSPSSVSHNNSSTNNASFTEEDEDDIRSERKANSNGKTLELKFLKTKSAESLIEISKEYGLETISDYGRQDIIYHILKNFSDQNPENVIIGEGVLEVLEDGFGFLRAPETNYFPGSDDIYVSPSQIKRFALRTGDTVKGQIRAP